MSIFKEKPRISIALATYNAERYLQTQLDSIAAQSHPPDELVITDDGSTDKTLKIIYDFSRSTSFDVRFSRNERRLGYSQNFNRALLQTTGDIVFLCDQDDVWFPEKLAIMTDTLTADPDTLLLMNDAALTDENLKPVGLTKLGQIRSAGLPESSFVMGCCVAMKRDLLELTLPIPEGSVSHDSWLVVFAQELGRKRIAETILQYYRRHSASTVKSIVNAPMKATRLRFAMETLKRVWQGNKVRAHHIAQTKALQLSYCDRAIGRLDGKYDLELMEFRNRLRNEIAILRRREALRALPKLRRLPHLRHYWKKGDYIDNGGLKTALRDFFLS